MDGEDRLKINDKIIKIENKQNKKRQVSQINLTNTHTQINNTAKQIPFFFTWAYKNLVGPLVVKCPAQLDNEVADSSGVKVSTSSSLGKS